MGRDRNKGRGGGRGGGKKMFIANVEELQMREREVIESRDARIRRRAGSDAEAEDANESDVDAPEIATTKV